MSNRDLEAIATMIDQRVWAVVGASNHPHKFGRRIFDSLKRSGYTVYAVNPNLDVLDDGTPTYPSVRDLPVVPDVVDVVVPPAAGMGVVDDCLAKGVRHIWFQPGAESEAAVAKAQDSGMTVLWGGPCAMVEAKHW
jgi:predicted CoA-binding protein